MQEAVLTPYLGVHDCAAAIEFYQRAFGAEETGPRFTATDGRVGHAEVSIGGSRIFISDEYPEVGALSPKRLGGSHAALHLRVADVDGAARRLVDAGATVLHEVADPGGRRASGNVPRSVRLPLDARPVGGGSVEGADAGANRRRIPGGLISPGVSVGAVGGR